MTAEMLTYKDGGVHTCCVHDGAGNSGCSKTQMVMKGKILPMPHIQLFHYHNNVLQGMVCMLK